MAVVQLIVLVALFVRVQVGQTVADGEHFLIVTRGYALMDTVGSRRRFVLVKFYLKRVKKNI